jgi:hypothetical protein
MNTELLSKNDELFCDLYVNGERPYVGDAHECYKAVFKELSKTGLEVIHYMARQEIKERIEELQEQNVVDTVALKKFLTRNLIGIVKEASTGSYLDRHGREISPAAMRSVAVNASKALMDMYPIKEAQVSKVNIEGGGEGGITFNVIVPETPAKKEDE